MKPQYLEQTIILMTLIGIIQILFMCFYFWIERKTTKQIHDYVIDNHNRTNELLIYNLQNIFNKYIDEENYEKAKDVKILIEQLSKRK